MQTTAPFYIPCFPHGFSPVKLRQITPEQLIFEILALRFNLALFKTCNQLELVYQSVPEVMCIWKCHLESKQPQVSVRMRAQLGSKRRQPHLLNSTSCLWGNGCPRAIALRNPFFPSFSETKRFANQTH